MEMEMDNSEKQFYCRLCAELYPEYNLIEINDEKSINFNLAYKIAHCYNIKITADDLLPKHVCSNCCDQVISSYEFHEQVQKAQETLIRRLVDIKVIKQENDETALSIPAVDNSAPAPPTSASSVPLPSVNKTDIKDILKSDDDFDYGANFLAYARIEQNSDSDNDDSTEDEKPLIERQKEQQKKSKSLKKKGRRKWKCVDCNEQIKSAEKLRNHYLNVHNKQPIFSCPKCPKAYNRYDSYLAHVRTHKGRFFCDICGNNYRDRGYLKQHIKLHSALTPFLCPHCNKTFKTSKLLKSHQRTHLPPEEKKKFECDECDKKFTTKAHLIFHKDIHSTTEPAKNFVCDQCGRNFKRKGTLVQHISTHLEVYQFRCDKCPKATAVGSKIHVIHAHNKVTLAFLNNSKVRLTGNENIINKCTQIGFKDVYGLRRHQKNHIDGVFYKCEICLRPFKHKRALKRHTSIHTNKLPHECEYCKKCFREKSYLKIHLRQHTGEKPYSCTQCNQHFTNDSNFIKHIRGRHGLEHFSIANQRQFPFIN